MNYTVSVTVLESINHANDHFEYSMLISNSLMNISIIYILPSYILHYNVEKVRIVINFKYLNNIFMSQSKEYIALIFQIVVSVILSIFDSIYEFNYLLMRLIATSVPVSWCIALNTVAKFPSPMTSLKV